MTKDREPTIRELVRDPALRTGAFVTAACVLVAFGALFLFKGPVAAMFPTAFAVFVLVFRWTWPIGVYILAVAYFSFLPDGTPVLLMAPTTFVVRNGGFVLSDMLLIPTVLAAIVAQYRYIGLTRQALPFDGDSSFDRKGGKVRRPAGLLEDRELITLVGAAVAATAFGQVVYYLITHVQFDFLRRVPLRWVPPFGREFEGIDVHPVLNRFMLLALTGLTAAGVGRLVFWYWGLLQLSHEQAMAVVTNSGWHESRRELASQERRRGLAKAESDRRGLFTVTTDGAR